MDCFPTAIVLLEFTDGFLTKRLARHLSYLRAIRVPNPIPSELQAGTLSDEGVNLRLPSLLLAVMRFNLLALNLRMVQRSDCLGKLRFRFRLHLFQPHQADQIFDPHMTGSSYASQQFLAALKEHEGQFALAS